MATFKLIEYKDASPEVRAIYDDIMATRKIDWINNFWKACGGAQSARGAACGLLSRNAPRKDKR